MVQYEFPNGYHQVCCHFIVELNRVEIDLIDRYDYYSGFWIGAF